MQVALPLALVSIAASMLVAGCGPSRPDCAPGKIQYRIEDTLWSVPDDGRVRTGGVPVEASKTSECPPVTTLDIEGLTFGAYTADPEPTPRNVVIHVRGHDKLSIIRDRVSRLPVKADQSMGPAGFEERRDPTARVFLSKSSNQAFDVIYCDREEFLTVSGQSLGLRCSAYAPQSPRVFARVIFYTSDWPLEAVPELDSQTAEFLLGIKQNK